MEKLGLNELRERYLSFFESKDHLRLGSFPLVPIDDNSLLLINAGMAPLKRYFTGELTPPRKRITTCQKCVRTPDIERVGKTARHGTFFEMLGNFSFGDYFKEQAIPWAWEFLTKGLEIPEELLYVSVYHEDDEAEAIWKKLGLPDDHIFHFGKEDNFWEIGSGPCGPCSEIFFDRGIKYGCGKPDCKVGCDCDRFIEIWNVVFTQFDGDGNGNYTRLAHPNIDTGMGLERLAVVMQDVNNLFEVDTVRNVMLKVCEKAGITYHGSASDSDVSLRVITDHIRGTTFLISDGVVPSNEGRGYVLRRLIRRAARHLRLLGIKGTFLSELCETVIEESKAAYPELAEKRDYIKKTLKIEEERFNQTIDAGLNILTQMIEKVKSENGKTLPGSEAFKLYDTFGFPLDLTKEILSEEELDVNEEEFNSLMKEQKERARAARAAIGDLGWTGDNSNLIDKSLKTEFVGYTENCCESEIKFIVANEEAAGSVAGGKAVVILDKTPFYAESGGQVGDSGTIKTENGTFVVEDTKKTHDGAYMHIGYVSEGAITLGEKAVAEINVCRRNAIRRNHTSAHLLQAALRSVLGTHVEQAGSYVDEHRVRFDFTHFAPMTADELKKVEDSVNTAILSGLEVENTEMPIEEAKKLGAMALFGEKYGKTVRVVNVKGYSVELCGGTHLTNSALAGLFKIVSESSVAAGVRRIEAVTGNNVIDYLNGYIDLVGDVTKSLKVNNQTEIVNRVNMLQGEVKELKKELEVAAGAALESKIATAVNDSEIVGSVKFVKATFENVTVDVVRNAIDKLKDKDASIVALFALKNDGKLQFVSGCGKDAVKDGAHAGMLLKSVSAIVGGGGGGRPDSATSGGKDLSKLDDAMNEASVILKNQLK